MELMVEEENWILDLDLMVVKVGVLSIKNTLGDGPNYGVRLNGNYRTEGLSLSVMGHYLWPYLYPQKETEKEKSSSKNIT